MGAHYDASCAYALDVAARTHWTFSGELSLGNAGPWDWNSPDYTNFLRCSGGQVISRVSEPGCHSGPATVPAPVSILASQCTQIEWCITSFYIFSRVKNRLVTINTVQVLLDIFGILLTLQIC